ncbi:DMT family transporter [Rhodoferax sp.]|uniref:DMT family transporter n=1 Tax=Rhodoferax sp. TaxID=50421 RepID=UPI0026166C81|nr:DMT family transporter [Rhodoferax sp.]MDD2919899.1 DMT family transporter [Rhodoferax sp.]
MTVAARLGQSGVFAALGAAVLFGAGTPLAKLLLGNIDPWVLAGLFYLGSGLGLWLLRRLRRAAPVRLPGSEWPWLGGAIVTGGVIGPVLLMLGLANMPATGAALLLNAESIFTALLAWFIFKENVNRRTALGMLAIVLGALSLSWSQATGFAPGWPALAILGACLAWGLDNNLTRRVSQVDASWLASVKGAVAGSVNLALALFAGASLPSLPLLLGAAGVGFMAYGVSLTLFVVGLRHLGTARTAAYFSVAPFFGAALTVPLLGDPVTPSLLFAALAMGVGVWLHLTERHDHAHQHGTLTHSHPHFPDAQHRHRH